MLVLCKVLSSSAISSVPANGSGNSLPRGNQVGIGRNKSEPFHDIESEYVRDKKRQGTTCSKPCNQK